MTTVLPTEQLVEDVAAVYFGAMGATIKRGIEIDDAGERGGATEVMLTGRLSTALHRLNPACRTTPSRRSCASCRARRTRR